MYTEVHENFHNKFVSWDRTKFVDLGKGLGIILIEFIKCTNEPSKNNILLNILKYPLQC